LDNHSKVFETPKGLLPICDHDHAIHLILGSVPPNIRLYRYPYAQNSEIERMVAEMLEVGIIQSSQSSFSAPVVLVQKKNGSWHVCPDYRELNKFTIKGKFPILVIDELLFTSPSWIFVHDIIKSERILKTFQKQHLELMRVIMNFWSCLLALPMHLLHFKVWRIPFSNPSLENLC